MTGQINNQADGYADKLTKLLPAEGIAALTTINSLMPVQKSSTDWLLGSAAIVGAFVFLWARLGRQVRNPLQLAFIMLAYLLWSTSILWVHLQALYDWAEQAPPIAPAIAAILFGLFIPFVFPPQQPQQQPVNSGGNTKA